MAGTDFSSVTEVAGYNVTREQIERMHTRYLFAAGFCKGKDVLEVACGSGQGLGLIARVCRKVTGGDIDEKNVKLAAGTYKNRPNIAVMPLDAHTLPFPDASLDVVILFEAIYYLREPEKFLAETRRVLRQGGRLLICSANKSLPDFNPSPFTYRYFSAPEFSAVLGAAGFRDIALFGDCPVGSGPKAAVVSAIKKLAVSLHLIPKTMKGKELFKRIFYGKLVPMPAELGASDGTYTAPSPISASTADTTHKVIFAVAAK